MIGVLVVDDDFRVARIHRSFVDRIPGFGVVGVAHSGASCLDQVRRHAPDLVLLDLYLPDMFGLDVAARLRADGHDCDVLVISAAKEADAIRGAVRSGVVNYLLKPFGFDDLRTRLEQYATQRTGLYATSVHDQADIDRALTCAPRAGNALPKGLSSETDQLVRTALSTAAGTLSAAECADQIGISRVSARRYLEHLHTTARADVTLRYSVPGRPERRYRWIGA
ncbi:response regulator [Actinoplanes derwentensis]|uniref:Transcriptional regulatory protein n=1 Tax=Actinoplanes derwentensis TaxID=113562 RepID=A0A1H1VSZ4_9ACTN|nr:response regulator [Actinoplanes derwentensis]GID83594.1 transcriptional regulatory protein [Actinoplanes derwentensis]SDS87852.1 Response regulator of citrate/malate metabolism [Actinoplanes derwentensis]